MTHPFLAVLDDAARAADAAERAYRREAAERIAVLDRARADAYRRRNLMAAVAEAAAAAESEEIAVAHALTLLRARLGWTVDSEARDEVIARFAPVAAALFPPADRKDDEAPPDPAAALAAFEAWYLAARRTPFWLLFETVMPETPLVDF